MIEIILNLSCSLPGQFPWQVQLKLESGQGFCGGIILSRSFILTAAHCVKRKNHGPNLFDLYRTKLFVAVGIHDLREGFSISKPITDKDKKLGKDIIEVETIIVHPKWNLPRGTAQNDIALLKLKTSIQYGDPGQTENYQSWSRPACLPTPEFDSQVLQKISKQDCVISGWGKTMGTGKNDFGKEFNRRELVFGKISLNFPFNLCNDKFYKKTLNKNKSQFCAIDNDQDSSVDACQGDSGGPVSCAPGLLTNPSSGTSKVFHGHHPAKNDIRFAVTGLVSYGYSCKNDKNTRNLRPGVYTKISSFYEWISKYTQEIQLVDGNTYQMEF